MAAKKKQRYEAGLCAIVDMQEQGFPKPPKWEQASIQATFYKPGNRAKRSDDDGLNSWLKSSADGLEDAGIMLNDSGFRWLPPVQIIGAAAGPKPKVVIVVTKIQEDR